jgi:hypothetical protein
MVTLARSISTDLPAGFQCTPSGCTPARRAGITRTVAEPGE